MGVAHDPKWRLSKFLASVKTRCGFRKEINEWVDRKEDYKDSLIILLTYFNMT